MKKEVRPLIYTLIVLVILIAAYPTYLFVSKTMTEIKIERMLVKSGYDQHHVQVTGSVQHELK